MAAMLVTRCAVVLSHVDLFQIGMAEGADLEIARTCIGHAASISILQLPHVQRVRGMCLTHDPAGIHVPA